MICTQSNVIKIVVKMTCKDYQISIKLLSSNYWAVIKVPPTLLKSELVCAYTCTAAVKLMSKTLSTDTTHDFRCQKAPASIFK